MKKFIISIASLMSVLLMSSCEDFLDQPIRGQENLDTYFQNETEASKFLSSCYAAICYNDWWQIGKFWNMLDMCTDDAWMGNTTPDQSDYYRIVHYQGVGQSNEAVANFWQNRYKGILRCNIAIERMPQASIFNENIKNRFI